MTFNRADFSYTATASGYMIQYKGQNIGGAGTLQPYKGRQRAKQVAAHAASAMRCITELVEGRGQQRFLDAIEGIDNPALPSTVIPRVGFLKLDRQERFNTKRAWFVNAYRIVDAEGNDMVQPWSNTKTEARATAKALGITLDESHIK